MRSKKMTATLLVLALLMTMLPACGGATPVPTAAPTQPTPTLVTKQAPPTAAAATATPVPPPTVAPTPTKNKDAKIILRVGTGDSGEGLTPHQDIIMAFEKANPDILVQLEAVAGSDYYARLLTQIASNDAPDIMQIGDDAVPMFVSKGAFVDLAAYMKGQYPLDPGIYLPGLMKPGEVGGKQYFLPKDYSPLAVYYNKKIFDQYRRRLPEGGLDLGRLPQDRPGADQGHQRRRQDRHLGRAAPGLLDHRL